MSVVSWHRIADDLTKQVRELQADLAAMTKERDEAKLDLAAAFNAQTVLAESLNLHIERLAAAREELHIERQTGRATTDALIEAREEARKWEWVAREVVLSGYSRADIMQGLHEHDIAEAFARYQSEEDV